VSTSTAISGCFQPGQAKVVLGPTPLGWQCLYVHCTVHYSQRDMKRVPRHVLYYMFSHLRGGVFGGPSVLLGTVREVVNYVQCNNTMHAINVIQINSHLASCTPFCVSKLIYTHGQLMIIVHLPCSRPPRGGGGEDYLWLQVCHLFG
jgi:hypothetical protein